MKTSDSMLKFIKGIERLSLAPYWDAKGWSIGYGHFMGGTKDKTPANITQAQADAFFKTDISPLETKITSFLTTNKITFNQDQFDAILDLSYNAGWGVGQKALTFISKKDYTGAKNYINSIVKAKDSKGVYQVLNALVTRRKYEQDLLKLDSMKVVSPSSPSSKSSGTLYEVGAVVLFVILMVAYFYFKKHGGSSF